MFQLHLNKVQQRFSMIQRLIILLFSLGMSVHFFSCQKEEELKPIADPKEVLDVPGFDGNGAIIPTKISNSGKIIGYIGSAVPRGSVSGYYMDASGFAINSDGTGFVNLLQAGQHSNWPFDINKDGVIVGAYLPNGNYAGYNLPAYAYLFDTNSGFKAIHPSGAFYSIAKCITNSGIILGEYGVSASSGPTACIFSGGSVTKLMDNAEVQCANDEIAILSASDGSMYTFFKYTFASSQLTKLFSKSNYTKILAINDEGFTVGYTEDQGARVGLIYNTMTDQMSSYNNTNTKGNYTYDEHAFFDINNNGKIVGRSFRPWHGPHQSRAMSLSFDLLGWRDITPEGSEAYSEMNSVNDNDIAVGSMGILKDQGAVVNKLFIVNLN
jgi:hypothetical protein